MSLALIGHTRKIGQNHLSGSSNAVFMHDYTKFINHAGRFPIAEKMAVAPSVVNIKATTHEGLGPLGQGEGIAAYAAVLLTKV